MHLSSKSASLSLLPVIHWSCHFIWRSFEYRQNPVYIVGLVPVFTSPVLLSSSQIYISQWYVICPGTFISVCPLVDFQSQQWELKHTKPTWQLYRPSSPLHPLYLVACSSPQGCESYFWNVCLSWTTLPTPCTHRVDLYKDPSDWSWTLQYVLIWPSLYRPYKRDANFHEFFWYD